MYCSVEICTKSIPQFYDTYSYPVIPLCLILFGLKLLNGILTIIFSMCLAFIYTFFVYPLDHIAMPTWGKWNYTWRYHSKAYRDHTQKHRYFATSAPLNLSTTECINSSSHLILDVICENLFCIMRNTHKVRTQIYFAVVCYPYWSIYPDLSLLRKCYKDSVIFYWNVGWSNTCIHKVPKLYPKYYNVHSTRMNIYGK